MNCSNMYQYGWTSKAMLIQKTSCRWCIHYIRFSTRCIPKDTEDTKACMESLQTKIMIVSREGRKWERGFNCAWNILFKCMHTFECGWAVCTCVCVCVSETITAKHWSLTKLSSWYGCICSRFYTFLKPFHHTKLTETIMHSYPA